MEGGDNHPLFTHKESLRRSNTAYAAGATAPSGAVETEYGIRQERERGGRKYLPNMSHIAIRGSVPGMTAAMATRPLVSRLVICVPIDDESSVVYNVDHVPLFGEDAERYLKERDRCLAEFDAAKLAEVSEAIIAGRMTIEDMDSELSSYETFWIEDYVTQVGCGVIVDRSVEVLGQIDRPAMLFRKVWERELQALADGRPTRTWADPTALEVGDGPHHVLTGAQAGG